MKFKNKKGLVFVMLLLVATSSVMAQIDTTFSKQYISYSAFLGLIGKNNLSYAVENFNMKISEANLETAKIFPDPEVSFGWFDNGQRRMSMGYGFGSEMSWTLELGGKRKARMNLAKSETELTKYLLQDYFRNLRADATVSFLLAIQNKFLTDVQWSSYKTMLKLSQSDSVRFSLGDITRVDARQSKLEAGTMLNDVLQAEADWKIALVNLSLLSGEKKLDTLYSPIGDFTKFDRDFNLIQLITTAQNNRADALAATQNIAVSQNVLNLSKANRIMDVGISGGVTYASYVRNIVAPTPSFAQFGAGISIPLKFSNNHPGEIKAAYYNTLVAETQYRQIELQIQTEVTQAYYSYQATQKQVQQFNTGLLTEAKAILDGKIYSYQRGENNLLEVLNAQRTYNEVQQGYYQALYNYAAALVELERVAGIWDINF